HARLLPPPHAIAAPAVRSLAGGLGGAAAFAGRRATIRLPLRQPPQSGERLPCTLACWPGSPFFGNPLRGRPQRADFQQPLGQPEIPATADCRQRALTPGRRLRTRVAGLFLFLPLLAHLPFDTLVTQAAYPGSRMVPAVAALLSLLALKLLDKERR